jgi:hypothetical protein
VYKLSVEAKTLRKKVVAELLTRQTRKIAHRVTFPLPFPRNFLCKAEKTNVRFTGKGKPALDSTMKTTWKEVTIWISKKFVMCTDFYVRSRRFLPPKSLSILFLVGHSGNYQHKFVLASKSAE